MPHKRAALVITVVASGCVLLAGCGGGSGSPGGSAAGPVKTAPSNPSTSGPKLTGNFCTDFKNIGTNMPIPAADSGSLATMEQHDGRYLNQVADYYSRLAAEAPPQVGLEVQSIASAYQDLASSIETGSTHSLSQIEQRIGSLTSSGAAGQALKKLVMYMTTKCS